MSENRHYYRSQRSFFWPFLLISSGIVWIMINQGIIEPRALNLVLRFWPVLLVIAGLQIMFGRRFPWLHNLFLAVLFAGMVYLLYRAEDLNLVQGRELKTDTFISESIPAEASVLLDIEYGDLDVSSSSELSDLLRADVTHDGDANFMDNQKDDRDVRLFLENDEVLVFDMNWFEDFDVHTDVELSTDSLLDFSAELSSGNGSFKLGDLNLEQLVIENSSGNMTIDLPAGEYPASIKCSSGNVEVTAANNTNMDLSIDVSSGNITVYLPEDIEGTLYLEVGSGSIDLIIPDSVGIQLSGSVSSGSVDFDVPMLHSGDEDAGTWISKNFDEADSQVIIEFDVSSGNLDIE